MGGAELEDIGAVRMKRMGLALVAHVAFLRLLARWVHALLFTFPVWFVVGACFWYVCVAALVQTSVGG